MLHQNKMTEHPNIQNRRIRMLYSLKDIQLALSAADFLQECDPNEPIGKIPLRRYKCFETTAIISYARPFSDSKGGVPKLSMKMIGVKLNEEQHELHNEILDMRNKSFAHSDAEFMRMVVKLPSLDIGNGERMPYVLPSFDEGLDFVGDRVSRLLELFHTVYEGIYMTLLEDSQINPDKFDFQHDWLFPE
jgi:hypothetical protein